MAAGPFLPLPSGQQKWSSLLVCALILNIPRRLLTSSIDGKKVSIEGMAAIALHCSSTTSSNHAS